MEVNGYCGNSLLLESVLEALSEIGCPIYSTELIQYMQARRLPNYPSLTSRRIERFMLSHLEKHEIRGTPLLQPSLCPALTVPRGEPIIRLMARSDWPLESRIVTATTARLRHLHIIARL